MSDPTTNPNPNLYPPHRSPELQLNLAFTSESLLDEFPELFERRGKRSVAGGLEDRGGSGYTTVIPGGAGHSTQAGQGGYGEAGVIHNHIEVGLLSVC